MIILSKLSLEHMFSIIIYCIYNYLIMIQTIIQLVENISVDSFAWVHDIENAMSSEEISC